MGTVHTRFQNSGCFFRVRNCALLVSNHQQFASFVELVEVSHLICIIMSIFVHPDFHMAESQIWAGTKKSMFKNLMKMRSSEYFRPVVVQFEKMFKHPAS